MPFYKDESNQIHALDDPSFFYLLPFGCVEISEAEAAALQNPSLAKAKAMQWEAIKAERDRRQLNGGVQVASHWFLSTERATGEYNSLINASQGLPADTVLRRDWRTMDGATIDMTPALARQILMAGIAQRCAIDDAALVHKAAMEASADPSAYDFSAGWPSIFTE
jgi:hypothetical protein